MTLVRMIAVEFSVKWSFLSILMYNRVLFLEVLYDPFSYEMRGDVLGDDWEFGGVSNGVDDAMSNGSGDSGGEDDVKAEDISVLISEFVF